VTESIKKDVVISGVGGQGNILASLVLGRFAMSKGLNILGTESIGAAQREGPVVSHVRISSGQIYSPLIPDRQADVLVGMEELETIRHIRRLNPNGTYLINLHRVPTALCNMGLDKYPDEDAILNAFARYCPNGYSIRASEIAKSIGDLIYTNMVILGALTKIYPFFEKEAIREIAGQEVPKRAYDKCMQAFAAGYEEVKAL